MIHPDTELRTVSPEVGFGVYATRPIPAGTIVYVLDRLERVVPPFDPLLRDGRYAPAIEKYSYIDPSGDRVLSWDLAKYVNHSCDPNSLSTGYGFEIAIRDIPAGDELTDDYGMLNLRREMECLCGCVGCRKVIRPDDLATEAPRWDRLVRPALRKLRRLPQPLWSLLEEDVVEALEGFLLTGRGYRSVRALQCPRGEYQTATVPREA
ncbi:MAG: SET domain-containing protein [Phycisphaerae bacterium]